ncbi:membrane protein insertion efficiency factor YidD [Kibdelosporangium phytohabitans]|uniref:membrane protein insertion efficiency factor YidD n=1 Tax=Kibdelosporangium phytohabitans TaxID=860235 RepID=UPI0009F8CE1C|nr:membrane protein insertion efficiency factor YidD [Kibdelosporangium phytohabitans]MBE1466528.1 putative membrane protein insertion efficiency factor [Kibdelosporangium phytohabitans]
MTDSPDESTDGAPRRTGPVAWVLLLPIHVYRKVISPLLPPTCRYYPSCSTYAVEALKTHGAIKGLWLAVWRLLRCNPWSSGGIDPVPPRRPRRKASGTPAHHSSAEE